ncbi:stage II sporulation protein M [Hugenholtzia roseola]|uniref:stage II sporulation protein M n=1 Tax=Hugenholtzia roseola TaxID=1002 RepID=UPI000414B71C|nr:stage II sporulation protein M [Hugenholtzia roseola]
MRENEFIRQNKSKWLHFENLLVQKHKDPDELAEHFIKVTDDLSYARTFYRHRVISVYLNGLAQRVFNQLFRYRSKEQGSFVRFWTHDLPLANYHIRYELLISFVVFALAFCIGVLSNQESDGFARLILGDAYINMTESNISQGDPMAVYKDSQKVNMFLGITLNNVRIAFMVFVLGALGGIGTLAILIKNGVMVGVFQHFFYQKGVFLESFATIWVHGTLEILAIIVVGGAGMTLSRGLFFPNSYTRLQSFQMAARRSIKVIMGIVPVFVVAAFIESFVTRYTELSYTIRFMIIISSLLFMIFYFVFYPFWVARRLSAQERTETQPAYQPQSVFKYYQIRSARQLIKDTFTFYKKHIGFYLKVFALVVFPLSFLQMYQISARELADKDFFFFFLESEGYFVHYLKLIFGLAMKPWAHFGVYQALNTLLWLLSSLLFLFHIEQKTLRPDLPLGWNQGTLQIVGKFLATKGLLVFATLLLVKLLVLISAAWIWVVFPLLSTILAFWVAERNAFSFWKGNVLKGGFYLAFLLVLVGFYLLLLGSPLLYLLYDSLISILGLGNTGQTNLLLQACVVAFAQASFFVAYPLFIIAMRLLYGSEVEKSESLTLQRELSDFHFRHQPKEWE